MRKALLATFAAIAALFVTPVLAANLPVKAAPAPVVAATTYDWSGFYDGIGAGWGHGSFDWRYTNPVPVTCCAPFSESLDDTILSTILGAQVQFSWLVIGVEGTLSDFINDRFSSFPGCVGANNPAAVCESRLGRTVGGRGGLAFNQWLIYGEGGWAHTTVDTRLTSVFTGINGTNPFDDGSAGRNGTYWGAGIDYMAAVIPHFALIIGVEYQHINFGTDTILSSLDGFNVCPPGDNCRSISAKADIVRLRLTGKWNPFEYVAAPAVTTRY